MHQSWRRLRNFDRQSSDMLAVAVDCEFISAWTRDGYMLQTQVDIGVAKAGDVISTDGLVIDLCANQRRAFDLPEFDGEGVLALCLTSDLREDPKRRKRSTKIRHDKPVEQPHQAKLACLLFANVIAQCRKKKFGHEYKTAFRHCRSFLQQPTLLVCHRTLANSV